MSWKNKAGGAADLTKNAEGDWEAHDGTRVRAVIVRRPKSARPYHVHRIDHTGVWHSADDFRTLAAARDFILNRPGVWGV